MAYDHRSAVSHQLRHLICLVPPVPLKEQADHPSKTCVNCTESWLVLHHDGSITCPIYVSWCLLPHSVCLPIMNKQCRGTINRCAGCRWLEQTLAYEEDNDNNDNDNENYSI